MPKAGERPNGKQPIPKLLRRTERIQVSVSVRDLDDLKRIGAVWEVPAATVLWALACDRLATLRGEALVMTGGELPARVSEALYEHMRKVTVVTPAAAEVTVLGDWEHDAPAG